MEMKIWKELQKGARKMISKETRKELKRKWKWKGTEKD